MKHIHSLNDSNRAEWQHDVVYAIDHFDEVATADALALLTAWPVLRAWAASQKPERANRSIIAVYLRDALAWSGYKALMPHEPPSNSPRLGGGLEASASVPITAKSSQTSAASPSTTPAKQAPIAKQPVSANAPSPQTGRVGEGLSGGVGGGLGGHDGGGDGQRPRHFDQYRQFVPLELQERFDVEIADLYLLRQQLGTRRDHLAETVEQAMYAGDTAVEDSASAQLADVAQQLINADTTLRHFWALVDVAVRHYQLNGEVMPIEDLREQAPVTVSSEPKKTRAPRTKDYTKAEIEEMISGTEDCEDRAAVWEAIEVAKADRIRKNKNFLRDKRKYDMARAAGGKDYEAYVCQMRLRANELEAWGVALNKVARELLAAL